MNKLRAILLCFAIITIADQNYCMLSTDIDSNRQAELICGFNSGNSDTLSISIRGVTPTSSHQNIYVDLQQKKVRYQNASKILHFTAPLNDSLNYHTILAPIYVQESAHFISIDLLTSSSINGHSKGQERGFHSDIVVYGASVIRDACDFGYLPIDINFLMEVREESQLEVHLPSFVHVLNAYPSECRFILPSIKKIFGVGCEIDGKVLKISKISSEVLDLLKTTIELKAYMNSIKCEAQKFGEMGVLSISEKTNSIDYEIHHDKENAKTSQEIVCNVGEFKSDEQCFSCPDGCLQCISQDKCSTCFPDMELTDGVCQSIPLCKVGMYMEIESCEYCPKGCLECKSSYECTKCGANYSLMNTQCKYQCAQGEYSIKYSEICVRCPSKCVECLSPDYCLKCAENYTLTEYTCKLNCPSSQYVDSSRGQDICLECPANCDGCLSVYECTSCKPGYHLWDSRCNYDCPKGQYSNPYNNGCSNCPKRCSQCNSEKECTECAPGYTISKYGCALPCPEGQYSLLDINGQDSCLKCPQNCLKCVDYYDCIECDALSILEYGYCSVICDPNNSNIDSSQPCQKCPLHCTACLSNFTCVKCEEGYSLYNEACIYACEKGKFPSEGTVTNYINVVTQSCYDCPTNCIDCYAKDQCVKCQPNYYLHNGYCYSACSIGYYGYVFTDFKCVQCPNHCGQCWDDRECTKCESDYTLRKGQCVKSCAIGQYYGFGFVDYLCIDCPSTCTKCNNEYTCSECKSPYILMSQRCVIACQAGEYYNNGVDSCVECPSECEECISPYECLSCQKGYALYYGVCKLICESGKYGDYIDSAKAKQSCVNCPPTCLECKSSYECTKCADGYSFDYGWCSIKCPSHQYIDTTGEIQSCAECPKQCSSCYENYYCLECLKNYEMYNGECKPMCNDGLYGIILYGVDTCLECPAQCTKCKASNACIECTINHILYDGECKLICPPGQYGIVKSNEEEDCVSCPSECTECWNIYYCTKCKESYGLYGGVCYKECGYGKYSVKSTTNMDICVDCPNNCRDCGISGACNACDEGFSPSSDGTTSSPCNIDCESGFYNIENRCKECSKYCDSCSNQFECKSCTEGYFLYNGECVDKCPSGYYFSKAECLKCGENCDECSNPYTCLKCISSPDISLVEGICTCNINDCKDICSNGSTVCTFCNIKYVYNADTQICEKCNIESLNRKPLIFVYQICTGEFTQSQEFNHIEMDKGYSGDSANRNDVCSFTGTSKGVIPPGEYIVSDIKCTLQNKASSRILELSSQTNNYQNIMNIKAKAVYYIYPETTGKDEMNGEHGIVLSIDAINKMSTEDIIKVTASGCEKYFKNCASYPPPSIGEISYVNEGNNQFRINFINWGDSLKMDITKFKYSAAIKYNSMYIEICEDTSDINENGILCNKGNALKLGYLDSTNQFTLRAQVKYNIESKNSQWASIFTSINAYSNYEYSFANKGNDMNGIDALKSKINCANASSLFSELMFRSQVLDNKISLPSLPPSNAECISDYCNNGGSCELKRNIPICKCPTGFNGITCLISSSDYALACTQKEEAAQNLLSIAGSTSADQIVNIINVITYNTDVLTVSALQSAIESLGIALKSSTSTLIDTSSLSTTVANIFSAVLKNMISKSSSRKLTDISSNNTSSIEITDLSTLLSALQQIIASSSGDLIGNDETTYIDFEGLMKAFIFDSSIGTITNQVSISVSDLALICSMVFPNDISEIFPTFNALTNDSWISSDIVILTAQNSESPFDVFSANKTITFDAANIRRLGTPNEVLECGYYDELSDSFSTEGCTTVDSGTTVTCNCDSDSAFFYLMGSSKTNKSKAILIVAIVVPVGACIICAVVVTTVLCLRKKKLEHKLGQVDGKATTPGQA